MLPAPTWDEKAASFPWGCLGWKAQGGQAGAWEESYKPAQEDLFMKA